MLLFGKEFLDYLLIIVLEFFMVFDFRGFDHLYDGFHYHLFVFICFICYYFMVGFIIVIIVVVVFIIIIVIIIIVIVIITVVINIIIIIIDALN